MRSLFYIKRTFLIGVVLGILYCTHQIGLAVWFSQDVQHASDYKVDQRNIYANKELLAVSGDPDTYQGQKHEQERVQVQEQGQEQRQEQREQKQEHEEPIKNELHNRQNGSEQEKRNKTKENAPNQQVQGEQKLQQQQDPSLSNGTQQQLQKGVEPKTNQKQQSKPKQNSKTNNNKNKTKKPGSIKNAENKGPPSSPVKPYPIVLATTNSPFLDFTKNWLESIRRLKVRPRNITIVAEDKLTFTSLANYTEVHRMKPSVSLPPDKILRFDSPAYKAFVNKRPKYILDFLEQGHDVLFSDVDTLWLQDPFEYFNEKDYHLFLQQDQPAPKLVLCAGFVYYRSTPKTIEFVKAWIRRLKLANNKKPDQMVLNIMIREKAIRGLKYKILDPRKFLSGQHYFDDDWRKNNTDVNPVFLHNNWIIGHNAKVGRFKKVGHWYV